MPAAGSALAMTSYGCGDALGGTPGAQDHAGGGQTGANPVGEHQDAVVAAAFLTMLGTRPSTTDGSNGFTYGVLLASELVRAHRIRRAITA
jgi:hypothetical protein